MKKLILGSPGCGKTTKLISIVEDYLEKGMPPERIAFMTFTKSGAEEAANRAMARFDFKEHQLPHFRTLHSMCYREVGARKVMGWRDYKELSEELRYNVCTGQEDRALTRGQMIRHVEEQARTRCIPIEEAGKLLAPEINPFQLAHYRDTLNNYKQAHKLMDFTDLLERYALSGSALDVDVVIIDEAQDLTELQWRVVEVMSATAADIYYAGDDDQTIHVWAGACIDRFMKLGEQCDEIEVLEKSHRLPRVIHKYAEELSSRIRNRYPKQWGSRDAEGTLTRLSWHVMGKALPLQEGEWFLLARNKRGLADYIEVLQHSGHFYVIDGEMYLGEVIGWIRKWEALRNGVALSYRDVSTLYSKCFQLNVAEGQRTFGGSKGMSYLIQELRADYGLLTDAVWYDAFDRIPIADRNYIQSCLRNGEDPDKPRIRLMTIHASKGLECENVAILADTSKASADELYREPDSEHRVFYVGATRAKENLYLVHESQENHYRL